MCPILQINFYILDKKQNRRESLIYSFYKWGNQAPRPTRGLSKTIVSHSRARLRRQSTFMLFSNTIIKKRLKIEVYVKWMGIIDMLRDCRIELQYLIFKLLFRGRYQSVIAPLFVTDYVKWYIIGVVGLNFFFLVI